MIQLLECPVLLVNQVFVLHARAEAIATPAGFRRLDEPRSRLFARLFDGSVEVAERFERVTEAVGDLLRTVWCGVFAERFDALDDGLSGCEEAVLAVGGGMAVSGGAEDRLGPVVAQLGL